MIGRGHRGRTDKSHAFWRDWFRKHGVMWLDLSSVGNGCGDGLVCWHGVRLALVEVKERRGTLTPAQLKFHAEWPVWIVRDEPSAKDLLTWLTKPKQ